MWTPLWLHITEIERDFQFMANVLGTLQNFYIQNILPEVLTRKIENSAPKIFDGQKDKFYCFCNSPYSSYETWIGCDSEKCKWEWFHLYDWYDWIHMIGIVQFVIKKSKKWWKLLMQKIRKGKHRYF